MAAAGCRIKLHFLPADCPQIGGLATNIFDFDIGAVDAASGPMPFPFLDGRSATIFAPAPRSGARSSSPSAY